MDVEIEHPHVHHHAHGARHWADFAIPAAALLISLISIYVAWHHGQVMRALVQQNERLVQANSIPWLQLSGSNRVTDGLQDLSFQVTNQGVGPGEIRSVQILVDGRAVSNLREVLDDCCDNQDFRQIGTSTLLGRMIRPGEEVRFIQMSAHRDSQRAVVALNKARQSGRIETRLCYCSVFGDCWTVTSRDNERPAPVRQCTAPQPQYAD